MVTFKTCDHNIHNLSLKRVSVLFSQMQVLTPWWEWVGELGTFQVKGHNYLFTLQELMHIFTLEDKYSAEV